ncbi:serine/threonine-protein kinase [Planctomycetota bacterium]|nr:serine/threonine-protein kinase [Planctomycetota bacterium]
MSRGSRAPVVLSLRRGNVRVLGSDRTLAWRLPGLAARAAVFRFGDQVQVQLLEPGSVNGEPGKVGAWLTLASGDRLQLGSHELTLAHERQQNVALDRPPPGYTLERELGRGGFGVVYRGVRESDGRVVAVKVLEWAQQRHLRRFRREATVCLGLDHRAIVRVLQIGVNDTPPWVAMELIDGRDAAAALREDGPPTIERAIEIGATVADALTWLAKRQLVHRDVKLENVILSSDGSAKLTDFGLVKDLGADLVTLTASGVGLGTLAYAAPEQLENAKTVTPAADVFSLGASLYCLLTGEPPWRIERPADLGKVLEEPPRDIRDLRPTVPDLIAKLIHSTLLRDPNARPSAAQVHLRLAQLVP